MPVFRLALRNLLRHPLRSALTAISLMVAMFLLCILQALIGATRSTVEAAESDRLMVASAVSLYVDLPLSYRAKIDSVEGVAKTIRYQWFGGVYQDPSNFFGQFAVDEEGMLDMYPEIEVVDGSREAFLENRIGCLVGSALAGRFGWKVGDRIPQIGALFPHPEGPETPWEFEIEAIYEPTTTNFDPQTFFFHWDYFEKTFEVLTGDTLGVGVYVVQMTPDADEGAVIRSINTLFENGPQRVQTTTESEFQAQFVSMYGNIPGFLTFIGGGVFLAILFACLNTMLMSAGEQMHDIGILKALGFPSAKVFQLLQIQAAILCLVGGGAGVGLAKWIENGLASAMAGFLPGVAVDDDALIIGGLATLAITVAAGVLPSMRAIGRSCVQALGDR